MGVVTREELERREHALLAAGASFADSSAGRDRAEGEDPLRTCWQCDRDRILHCKSFRRLANKTQVFLAPEGDHYRTRLTHTLEVCQIACDIARPLGLNEDLACAIALGHDLGHTPFGHAGERALAAAMASGRGLEPASPEGRALFRHNEQSVRVVERLERGGEGLNLTREVRDGMLRHTGPVAAATPEGRVVARADRIAYVTHDIDDAERAGLLMEADLPAGPRAVLGSTSSQRIETMVRDVVRTSAVAGEVAMSQRVGSAMAEMRAFLFENVYSRGDARLEEPKASRLLQALFRHYLAHEDEVPEEYRLHDDPLDVQVADYLSSMTDRYAIRLYRDLFVPKAWSL